MRIRSAIKLVFLAIIVCGGLGVIAVGMSARKDLQQARTHDENSRKDRQAAAAQVTFNDPTPPTEEDSVLFGGILSRLGNSLGKQDAFAIGAAFDSERFTTELDRRGVIDRMPGIPSRNREECARSICTMLGRSLAGNESFRWDRVEVRRIRWSADQREAVVLAVHRHPLAADTPLKVRWWFVSTTAGWKVYDLEELDFGVRITELLGLILTKEFIDEFGANPQRFHAGVNGLREAIAAITVRKNVDEAERHLDAARRLKLPPTLLAIVKLLEARIFIESLNPEAALKRIDEVDQLHPNIPVSGAIRAAILNLLGRPDEALPLIRKYLEEVGSDPDGHLTEGVALEGLERFEEAATAFRKTLDESPDIHEALEALRRVLPDDQKAELGNRLAKASDPAKLYEEALALASEAGDSRAIEELQQGLKKAVPGDVRGITPGIRRLIENKKFTEATAEMQAALLVVGDDKKQQVLNAYLYSMADAQRHVEAYAAVPRSHAVETFRTLASELDDNLSDGPSDEVSNESAKQLRELIAAHRKHASDDVWIGFYDAVLLQNAKEYEKAERAFAAAQVAYLKTAKPVENEKDWQANQFRYRRIQCLYALKQGLKAYAEIGPEQETFEQLVWRYQADKDSKGLDALLAAHGKKSPDDLQLLYWAAVSLQMQEKPIKAAEAFRVFAKKANAEVRNYRVAVSQCVRNYLRAEQLHNARSAVMEFGTDVVPTSLQAAIALADGKPAEVEKILEDLATETDGTGHFYYDEDFARLMARPENAALRKKYPDPRATKPASRKD